MSSSKNSQVNRNNARPGIYKKVIKKIAGEKICPFCPQHLSNIHPHPLDVRKNWIITNNAYPYLPKKHHVLLIYKKHIENIGDLDLGAWKELHSILKELKKKRKIKGGTFMLRFGDTKYTGATVTHIHAHLFQSNPDNSTYNRRKGVLTRIG
jgi:diadenosine tetraphosphate (Ap4A) HIT family hydrolase